MANRKRPIVLRCPVTAEERALIEQKMALLPTQKIGAYLRKMAIDGYIIYLTFFISDRVDHQRLAGDAGVDLGKYLPWLGASEDAFVSPEVIRLDVDAAREDESHVLRTLTGVEDDLAPVIAPFHGAKTA